jgi:hypothetical protein
MPSLAAGLCYVGATTVDIRLVVVALIPVRRIAWSNWESVSGRVAPGNVRYGGYGAREECSAKMRWTKDNGFWPVLRQCSSIFVKLTKNYIGQQHPRPRCLVIRNRFRHSKYSTTKFCEMFLDKATWLAGFCKMWTFRLSNCKFTKERPLCCIYEAGEYSLY